MESVDGYIPLLFPQRRKFGDDEVQPHVRQHMVLLAWWFLYQDLLEDRAASLPGMPPLCRDLLLVSALSRRRRSDKAPGPVAND